MSNAYSDQMRHSELFGWHVYVVAERTGDYVKIGTAATPQYRIAGLQNGNPRRLDVKALFHLEHREDARSVESLALTILGGKRLVGRDWVRCASEDAIAAVKQAATILRVTLVAVET